MPTKPKMISSDTLMRRISKRAGGGKVTLTLTVGTFHAHVYPTSEQAREKALAKLKTSVSLNELSDALADEADRALARGRGKTIDEALADLDQNLTSKTGGPG